MKTENTWVLHIVAQTHWDREWYMGFERYRWRLVKLMDRLLDLFASQPEYKAFLLDGQVSALTDYLEIRPERSAEVHLLVHEGRLQVGPWFTQPHHSLASGEALIRNLQRGMHDSCQYGQATMISYNIDQFGHASQMPQIIRGFGLTDAVGWRGISKSSQSAFKWQAPDGSVVTMFYSNNGYGHVTALPRQLDDFTEYLDATPFQRAGLRTRIAQLLALRTPHAVVPHLFCLNGVDHSFAQEDLPEIIELINANIPGVHAKQSTLAEYITAVKDAYQQEGLPLALHVGEMFNPDECVLPDVHSLRPEQKQANTRVEGELEKWSEPFATLAWAAGAIAYPGAELRKAWEFVLLNHAHDSQACSSVDRVYQAVLGRYDAALDIAGEISEQSLQTLCHLLTPAGNSEAIPLVVFNPLSWTRQDLVSATLNIPLALGITNPVLTDEHGDCASAVLGWEDTNYVRYNPFRGHPTVVPVRRFQLTFAPGKVPALGYKRFHLRNASTATNSSLFLSPRVLENEFLHVTLHPNGTFDLYYKPTDALYPGLHFFADSGEAGDGFVHLAPRHDETVYSLGAQAEISVLHDTPVQATVQLSITMQLPEAISDDLSRRSTRKTTCRITSQLTLRAGSPRLDIETIIDNTARDHRLRVFFPSGLDVDTVSVAQPFDVVTRPITTMDRIHGQQLFVDVSDGSNGLLVANNGIYEYEVTPDDQRAIVLTLLRCTDRIYKDGGLVNPDLYIPQAQCPGEQHFSYSLIPHAGNWTHATAQAEQFRAPMRTVLWRELEEEALPYFTPPAPIAGLPESGSFISLEPISLVISTLKQREDQHALVLRFYNTSSDNVTAKLHLTIPGFTPAQAYRVNLNEEYQEPLHISPDGHLTFPVRGKEIVTITVEPKASG